MRTDEYLQATGFEAGVNRNLALDAAHFSQEHWIHGLAELVTSSAMLHSDRDDFQLLDNTEQAVHEVASRLLVGMGITPARAQVGSEISAVSHADGVDNQSADALVGELTRALFGEQSPMLSHFFNRRLHGEGGEDTISFNRRMLQQATIPAIRPYASVIGRRPSPQRNIYQFKVNGKPLDQRQDTHKEGPWTKIHATILELDALVALSYVVIQKKLPFIPIMASRSSEQVDFKGGPNFNADILLIRDDGNRVIPVQVKVQASKYRRTEEYDPRVALIDSYTLRAWNQRTVIVRGTDGEVHSQPEIEFTSGQIAQSACQRYAAKGPNPKYLRQVVRDKDDYIVEAVHTALCEAEPELKEAA